MLVDLKTINALGGIQARNTQTGADVYLAPGTLLHDIASAGQFGAVAPYIPPPDPVEPPAYRTAEGAREAMSEWIEGFVAPLVGDAPPEERLAWPIKEAAAIAYKAETSDPDQAAMIEGEAAITGEDPLALADMILARAAVYRPAVTAIAGLRRKVGAALSAEPDPYKFEAILIAAKAEAVQLARDLGLDGALGLS